MAWRIDFGKDAKRDFAALDKSTQRKIFQYLNVRVAETQDARSFGKALKHSFSGLWCYRVGDYKIICSIEDDDMIVLVVQIGHRSVVYDH